MVYTGKIKDKVYGEYHLHNVPDEYPLLEIVDHIENYDPENEKQSLYLRRKGLCNLDDIRKQVWFYFWPHKLPRNSVSITKW